MTIIGIVPARSGSSGIPNKNLINGPLLCGRRLITYTVDAAAESCDIVLVSTDDEATLHYADTHERGNVLGVRRPAHLCTATASSESAIMHALGTIEASDDDAIVFLQLTSPLRTAAHIRGALARWRASSLPTCVALEPGAKCGFAGLVHGDVYRPSRDVTKPNAPRQEMGRWRRENGAIYIASAGWWRLTGQRVAQESAFYDMSESDSIDIDEPINLSDAAARMGGA